LFAIQKQYAEWISSLSGELLLDQGRFEEAVEKFDKAIELEKAK
jgi:import receptor subunit TOM70